MTGWTFEPSPFGEVLVPSFLPDGFALFYSTTDFPGYLREGGSSLIERFLGHRFGIEARLFTCTQVHGVRVERVAASHDMPRESGDCDALYTDEQSVALGIKVADCLPVTVVDPEARVIANIHSGWRGAAGEIVRRAVETIEQNTDFQSSRAYAYLGPSIRVCCFQVGEEVIERFGTIEDARQFTDRDRSERPHFDLPAFTRSVLTSRGLDQRRVFDSGICTRCPDSRFHSYRRNGAGAGRNLAVAAQ